MTHPEFKSYIYFTMFYDNRHEEPKSYEYGQRVISACNTLSINYKTTYPPDAPECTIWVKKDNLKRLREYLSLTNKFKSWEN